MASLKQLLKENGFFTVGDMDEKEPQTLRVDDAIKAVREWLQQKPSKNPRAISQLIEEKYDEDEMGREYISHINYHDEMRFIDKKKLLEELEH